MAHQKLIDSRAHNLSLILADSGLILTCKLSLPVLIKIMTNWISSGQSLPANRNINDSHQKKGALERARVTFDEDTTITYIKDVSANYKSSLFYTKSEINRFKTSNTQALLQMQVISDSKQYLLLIQDTDTAAFLGLEICLGQKSYQESVMRRGALRGAIKSEQARQERLGIRDCDALANISEVKSQWSRERARAIALLHADA